MPIQHTEKTPSRHCMIVLAYYPFAETRVQREAEALVAHGYAVDIICRQRPGEKSEEQYRGVQIYRLPLTLRESSLVRQFLNYLHFFVLASIQLTRLHRRQPYAVVQAHNLPDFLVFCAFIPKLMRVPVILDLHDLMPEFFLGRFGEGKRSWLWHLIYWQERLACRFANHVITVSDHWRQALITRGVPANKCSVVMNVPDESIFHPQECHRRPLSDGEFRLIYHGSVVYRYGLDIAIRAIEKIKVIIPGIHLTIIGAGDQIDDLKKMITELDLTQQVEILRMRPAEELPPFIYQADLGIVPYRNDRFTDSLLPTKLMEYAAMGLPCLAARTTAIQTYFGNVVEFFQSGDVDDLVRCIVTLYNSPQRLAELADIGIQYSEQHSWRKIGAEYVALVEQLGRPV